MKPWNEARLQVHDASGIEKPEDWWWSYAPNTSVMYPLVKVDRIKECVQSCEYQLGEQWQADFPEIKSGDFDPISSLELTQALTRALIIWYETNK